LKIDALCRIGDIWLWTAICADTKVIPAWRLGDRDRHSANGFAIDLANRLTTRRAQITSDGLALYRPAIEAAFGSEADFAQFVKQCEIPREPHAQPRYSPSICTGATKTAIQGNPDPDHISTSFVERANLTLRMSCAATRARPMRSQRRSRTTLAPWRCT
jgi:IS1 family transposase